MNKFKSLLFIDDDATTNLLHKIIVDQAQITETKKFFASPLSALDYLKELGETDVPDIIFLDINMPLMNGWEFIEAYQKLNISKSKIVMVSSSKCSEDIEKAGSYNIVKDFINKPLSKAKIQELHEKYLGKVY